MRVARILAALVLAAATLVLLPAPAYAAAPTRGGSFWSSNWARCLDTDLANSHLDGGTVQIWECNSWPNQKWNFYDDGTVRLGNGMCLEADATGAGVRTWTCNGRLQQFWRLDGPWQGGQTLVSLFNQRCLDVPWTGGPLPGNGARPQLAACNRNSATQYWVGGSSAYALCNGNIAADETYTVRVDGGRPTWLPTMNVHTDVMRITAVGLVKNRPGFLVPWDVFGPEGSGEIVTGGSWPFQGGVAYSLFYRWGDERRAVEKDSGCDYMTGSAPQGDTAVLMGNDQDPSDNSGYFTATVSIWRGIRNPGFEQNSILGTMPWGGPPAGRGELSPNAARFGWRGATVRSGPGEFNAWTQVIDVLPNRRYWVDAWVRPTNLTQMRITWTFMPGERIVPAPPPIPVSGSDYRRVSFGFTTGQQTQTSLYIGYIGPPGMPLGSSALDIDDVSITLTP
jgi:hypothetical protein